MAQPRQDRAAGWAFIALAAPFGVLALTDGDRVELLALALPFLAVGAGILGRDRGEAAPGPASDRSPD